MNIITYLRQFKIFDFAIFDLVASFVGMFLLSGLLSKLFRKIGVDVPWFNWIFLTLPISIVAHLLVGRMTPMVTNFLDLHDHYFLKIVILACFVAGLWGIKLLK